MTYEQAYQTTIDGTTSPTELWRVIRPYLLRMARYFLARWPGLHSPVGVDDLVQVGFLEVLKRLDLVPGGKPWDPTAPNAWPLRKYVEYGSCMAMRRVLRNTFKAYKRGRPVIENPNEDATLLREWVDPFIGRIRDGIWSEMTPADVVSCREWVDALDGESRAIMECVVRRVRQGARVEDACRGYVWENLDRYEKPNQQRRVWRQVDKVIGTRMSRNFKAVDPGSVVADPEPVMVPTDEADALEDATIDELCERVKVGWTNFVEGCLPLARLLYHVRENELWRRGDVFRSYTEFLKTGAGMGDQIPSSTGSALPNAYRTALGIAEELQLPVDEVWRKIQWTKLAILNQAPAELRATMIERAMDGASRRELTGMLGADEPAPALAPALDAAPPLTSAEPPDPDERATGKVSSTEVLEADIAVQVVDLVTLQPAVGAPVTAIDQTLFRYPMRGGRHVIEFRVSVQDGKVRGGILRFVPRAGE